MKITSFFLFTAAVISLISCTENNKTTTTASESEAGTTQTTISGTSASSGLNEPLPAMPLPEATAATGNLNPEHGQPGHRCDIEVGAPLSSAPSQPATAATGPENAPKPTVLTMPSATPPPTSSGTGKINPPHGEPGHDCGKPVGQPL